MDEHHAFSVFTSAESLCGMNHSDGGSFCQTDETGRALSLESSRVVMSRE